MAGLLIVRPLPIRTIWGAGSGVTNLLTPSPREIWAASSDGEQVIEIDLQFNSQVDCFYLGWTNVRADAVWTIQTITAGGGSVSATHVNAQPMRLDGNIRTRYPVFLRLPAPVVGRYFRITLTQPVTAMQVGNLIVGLSLEWPYAYGSGRMPVDTSRVVALPDGGYGIDTGIVKSRFQWRFIDLDQATLDKLWFIAEDRGEARPLVVVEGPNSPPVATSVHYGLFQKFEPYEREDPASTKWALTIEEWR